MKHNFYAVKAGREPGIYTSWDDCKAQVDGYKMCQYKGFRTRQEAEDYMAENPSDSSIDTPKRHGEITAYVDGSFDPETFVYGYGCVLLFPSGYETSFYGAGNNPEAAKLRNVFGEILAALNAVEYALGCGHKSIEICYDYAGIESWVTGEWKTNNEFTAKYAYTMREWAEDIKISFRKVKAHTNVKYNEMADQLAKQGIADFVKAR